MDYRGWRQPKGGRWQLELLPLRGLPPVPTAQLLGDLLRGGLALAVLLLVTHASPLWLMAGLGLPFLAIAGAELPPPPAQPGQDGGRGGRPLPPLPPPPAGGHPGQPGAPPPPNQPGIQPFVVPQLFSSVSIGGGVIPNQLVGINWFDARSFGVVGNGSADDTALAQATITAAAAVGGIAYFREGIYKLTAPLTVPINTTIRGSGRRTIFAQPTSGAACFVITFGALTESQIHLVDFTIDGTIAGQGGGVGNGLNITLATQVVVERVNIINLIAAGQKAIALNFVLTSTFRHCTLHAKSRAIDCANNTNNVMIEACNIFSQAGSDGVVFDNTCEQDEIRGCNFQGSPAGNTAIIADGTLAVAIVDNFMENWTVACVSATTGVCQALIIQGNTMQSTNAAVASVKLASAGPNLGVWVVGNFFIQLGQALNTGLGIELGNTLRAVVMGNRGPGGTDALMVSVGGVIQPQPDFVTMTGRAQLRRIEVGVASPAALAAGNNNNYARGDTATLRLTGQGGGSVITGISAAGVLGGDRIRIVNVGAVVVTLNHQDANSLAANRLQHPAAANVALAIDDVADLEYDITTGAWRVVNVLQ